MVTSVKWMTFFLGKVSVIIALKVAITIIAAAITFLLSYKVLVALEDR